MDLDFWTRCKKVAVDRRISLNQLVNNGLHLALGDDDTVKVNPDGQVSNDLRGNLSATVSPDGVRDRVEEGD